MALEIWGIRKDKSMDSFYIIPAWTGASDSSMETLALGSTRVTILQLIKGGGVC